MRSQRNGRINAVCIGKPKVHESDVGPMSNETLDGLISVRGLRYNLHVRLAVDDRNDPFADKRMIFDT